MGAVIRRNIPQVIVTVIIVLMVLFYFFYISSDVKKAFDTGNKALTDWVVVITAIAAIVGGIDILRYHVNQSRKKEPKQVFFSGIVIVMEVIMVAFAVYALSSGIAITTQTNFQWLYTYIFAPSDAAMYSILVFYIASASYRAFRVRNPPALLLLIVAILIMLGNTSLGEIIWSGFLPVRDWIMTVPNTAAFRPITMGLGFGIIILGLRLLLGKEVTWMGRRE
ncbi:MAG: hypothetical protein QXL57_06570 [Candidatus Bathyarchaeia archaeon]